jgi:pimeloyl-ACP methyl ester carboxylesterase
MTATRFALLNPDRVTHLVLEDPLGLVDYRAGIPPQFGSLLHRLVPAVKAATGVERVYFLALMERWPTSTSGSFRRGRWETFEERSTLRSSPLLRSRKPMQKRCRGRSKLNSRGLEDGQRMRRAKLALG